MLTKKLQQVTDKQRRLGIIENTNTEVTNRVHSDIAYLISSAAAGSTNKVYTDVVVGRDKTNKDDGFTSRVGVSAGSDLNQNNTDTRVQSEIIRPVATKVPPLAKVLPKQVLSHQNIRQTQTRMPPRFSKNLKYTRQSAMRFPQRGVRGRSTSVLNYKNVTAYIETSKNATVSRSVDTRLSSSQPVPISSPSPLRLSCSPLLRVSASPLLQVSASASVHENVQQTLEQPTNVNTDVPVSSEIYGVDVSSVDTCDDNILKAVKYDCVAQEITQPVKAQTNLLQSTTRLKDYKSPLLHLHNSG